MQFGEDRAPLIERPRFDSREFSLSQPGAELLERHFHVIG